MADEAAAAVILCGGQSVRMGRDKATITIDGEPFLSRICRLVAPRFGATIVVAADGQSLPQLAPEVRVVRDLIPDGGPLAGLLSGLLALQGYAPEFSQFWLGGCDAPFVNVPVIETLLATPGDWQAVVVAEAGRIQPFGGVYRTSVAGTVRSLVESGERRLVELTRQVRTETVDAEFMRQHDGDLAFLRNINTQDDYRQYVVERE